MPLYIKNLGNANSFQVDDVASDTTPFVIDATGNVTIANTADLTLMSGQGIATTLAQLVVVGIQNPQHLQFKLVFLDAQAIDLYKITTAAPTHIVNCGSRLALACPHFTGQ